MLQLKLFCTHCQEEWLHIIDDKQPLTLTCEKCKSTLASIAPLNGYVYILSNPWMPNLIKIGFTTRDIQERLAELNSATGVPEPFIIEATFAAIPGHS